MGLANSVYAGWGDNPAWRFQHNNGTTANQKAASQAATVAPQVAESVPQAISAVSAVPKLFWADCGPNGFTFINNGSNQLCSGNLSYVDPFVAFPLPTLFTAGATFVTNNWNPSIGVMSGTLNPATYQITGLKEAFVHYFKLGKLYKVDTTTLVATQVSSEAGATAATLCQIQTLKNITAPLNSTIAYKLKGADGFCNTPDDVTRAVKFSMGPAVAPINLTKWPIEQLMDAAGTYISVSGWPTTTLSRCQANLTTCATIATTPNPNVWSQGLDLTRALLQIGGGIASYNYVTSVLTPLYTPLAGESVGASRLDRDGFVYFEVNRFVVPFNNTIRRVPVTGGGSVILSTYATTSPFVSMGLDITATHVGYARPNATLSGNIYSAVPKAGGVTRVISNDMVSGGFGGSVAIVEDSLGTVRTINPATGAVIAARANSQLNGITYGGSADWHYWFNSATSRFFLSTIDNQLKSYAFGDNFALPAAGIIMGTAPVNLNDVNINQSGNELVGSAFRTQRGWMSGGNDMLFLRATGVNSLKRLTNSNTVKVNSKVN